MIVTETLPMILRKMKMATKKSLMSHLTMIKVTQRKSKTRINNLVIRKALTKVVTIKPTTIKIKNRLKKVEVKAPDRVGKLPVLLVILRTLEPPPDQVLRVSQIPPIVPTPVIHQVLKMRPLVLMLAQAENQEEVLV